jgi:hypothetical protein
VALAVLAGVVYGGDSVIARWRWPRALGAVVVRPYYAVPLKDGKTEIMMLSPETRPCVHALFPHFGYTPCWYLDNQTQQRIDM